MLTALITHPACLQHEPSAGHPECPARLAYVLKALEDEAFAGLMRESAPRASEDDLARMHDRDYIRALLNAVPHQGLVHLDPDTAISPGSGDAVLRAAGAVVRGVDLVMAGEAKNAFCAVRPPGHHALPSRAMGFCVFNNIAVGAAHARAAYGLARIAVVDFDVHHGNGTEAMFGPEPDLFYASTHQWPHYPGTGGPNAPVPDNILDLPLPAGAGGPEFRRAFGDTLLPALESFAPEFILISAGFDAHRADPLASLRLEESDFAWATEAVCAVAARKCGGRVVSALEGGYDLDATARSAAAHVSALVAA
jgi:acetoin utilization deacetylase AcuC-like enzyme